MGTLLSEPGPDELALGIELSCYTPPELLVQGGAPDSTRRAGDIIFRTRRMPKKGAILPERSTQSLNRLSLGEEGVMT
jgi:hypothetical protein